MKDFRCHIIEIACCFGLLFLHLPFSIGQDASTADTTPEEENISESESFEPLKIVVSVNEVRLDVVALDKKGHPITDLTATDFEVYQNDKRQEVLSSVYVVNQSEAAAQPSASQKNTGNFQSLPSADLKKEDTSRTIIFIVDDLSMSSEDGYYAKMALRNFVEKQMQPGDMVAVLRTGSGNSALQMFISDKRQALARIDAIRMETVLSPSADGSQLFRVYDNQLSTLSYSLRALNDMPGRKILIMMTATPSLRKPNNTSKFLEEGDSIPIERVDFHALYNGRFSRLADDALRAGVVINFLNIGGLQNIGGLHSVVDSENNDSEDNPQSANLPLIVDASINIRKTWADARGATTSGEAARRLLESMLPETFEKERNSSARNISNPLPAKTGGVLIENSNFFLDGIGKETESLMKGYYLVSYAPPESTFNSDDKEIYNQIKIRVKRRGVQVHTRDGFYNRLESETDAVSTPAFPLRDAIYSPFQHAGINVNMSAGFIKDAKAGYLVRSWIHLDPRDVNIVETDDGGAQIDLEMVCLTSDINGYVQDFKHITHTINIEPEKKSENIAWIQKHGIRFAMLLPVKKSGSYYVRTAVEDKKSGKVGSAYQHVEIPDLGKKVLALSNIFIITSADDINWLFSDSTKGIDEGLFFPVFQEEEVRSPALSTYVSGDSLQTLMVLYNSGEDSEIEMQPVLYKDGVEFQRADPAPITVNSAESPYGTLVLQKLTVGPDMPPGDYVRQIVVTDKKNSKKNERVASQTLSFTVAEK